MRRSTKVFVVFYTLLIACVCSLIYSHWALWDAIRERGKVDAELARRINITTEACQRNH